MIEYAKPIIQKGNANNNNHNIITVYILMCISVSELSLFSLCFPCSNQELSMIIHCIHKCRHKDIRTYVHK